MTLYLAAVIVPFALMRCRPFGGSASFSGCVLASQQLAKILVPDFPRSERTRFHANG